jgi:hypothetical protein
MIRPNNSVDFLMMILAPLPNRCDPTWGPNKNGESTNCDKATAAQRLESTSVMLVFLALVTFLYAVLAQGPWVSEAHAWAFTEREITGGSLEGV